MAGGEGRSDHVGGASVSAWNAPDVRKAIRAFEAAGYEITGFEATREGFKLLTRAAPAAGNKPGNEGREEDDTPEQELARQSAKLAARTAGRV